MRKIVLVSARTVDSIHGESFEAVSLELMTILIEHDYTPVLLSFQMNEKTKLLSFIREINPELLVLTGGEDIGSNTLRDCFETTLLEWAEANPQVKVFGICRGMQFISHFLGGTLANIDNHVGVMHEIFHNGERVGLVNSFHSNEIINLPKVLQITSQTSDGCIESFVHINRPWFGWMWHPERMERPEWMKQKLKSILNP